MQSPVGEERKGSENVEEKKKQVDKLQVSGNGWDGLAERASLEGSQPTQGPSQALQPAQPRRPGPGRVQPQIGEPWGLDHHLLPSLGPPEATKANSAGLSTIS